MGEDTILKISDLVVEYRTDGGVVHAVNGFDLELKKGEALGLVGETGAGKTTVARSILRILPDPPAKICRGTIEFEGQEILKLSETQMRKIRGNKISMIFQDPMTALNPVETVGSQIAETIKIHSKKKMTKSESQLQAVEMLELVGIPGERFAEYPHQFSGGMKQRVIIAMALACKPDLLLADEPTTALDVTIQAQVLEMIAKLKQELGTSMILITHDLGIVAEMCERVAVVYAGEVVESGSADDIFNHTGHPYTEGLFNSLPNPERREHRLKPIRGLMPDPSNLPQGCKFFPRCPYAAPECESREPALEEQSPGHYVRCFRRKGEQ